VRVRSCWSCRQGAGAARPRRQTRPKGSRRAVKSCAGVMSRRVSRLRIIVVLGVGIVEQSQTVRLETPRKLQRLHLDPPGRPATLAAAPSADSANKMLFGEIIRVAFQSIRANFFRAILTMLGIIIGVSAVIAMLAAGAGAQKRIDDQ